MQREKLYNLYQTTSLTVARLPFKTDEILSYHISAVYKQYFFLCSFFLYFTFLQSNIFS